MTMQQTNAIEAGLTAAKLPLPKTMEINDIGYLVATYEIDLDDDAVLGQMVLAGVRSPKDMATKAVLTIRNAALPLNFVQKYRVTLNGVPPGPGLVHRYGSARFSEGGSVDWEPAK